MRLRGNFLVGMLSPHALSFFHLSESWTWFGNKCCIRLWRRGRFSMVWCRGIIAPILVQVCDGGYGKDVMKKW
jgi:hypothetical protein